MVNQTLLERHDLITLCPGVVIQSPIARWNEDSHAETRVLPGRDGDYAHVQGMPIERIDRQNEGRTRLVEVDKMHIAAPRITGAS